MRGGLVLAAALVLAGGARAATPTDEGTAHRIVGTGSTAMPAWSPDGSRLLFHARRKDDEQKGVATRNIWSVAPDGSGETKLTSGTRDAYHASLSPDGRKLLFVSELNGSRDIWIADADGQNPVPLTDDPGTEDQPAWSPDGRQIAYAAFPPDGAKLAFWRWPAHGRSADATLWIANADGTAPIELTAAPGPATHPAWSPDGRTLAFQHRAATGWELWTLALPADIARAAHLRLAQQVRGGADVDTAKLRSGDTVRGTLAEATFKVRAAYGALVLPRGAVASILFGS